MRIASFAKSSPIRMHSSQVLASFCPWPSVPYSNRVSAVTIPPWAPFINKATPPMVDSIFWYKGPIMSGLKIPRLFPKTSG